MSGYLRTNFEVGLVAGRSPAKGLKLPENKVDFGRVFVRTKTEARPDEGAESVFDRTKVHFRPDESETQFSG